MRRYIKAKAQAAAAAAAEAEAAAAGGATEAASAGGTAAALTPWVGKQARAAREAKSLAAAAVAAGAAHALVPARQPSTGGGGSGAAANEDDDDQIGMNRATDDEANMGTGVNIMALPAVGGSGSGVVTAGTNALALPVVGGGGVVLGDEGGARPTTWILRLLARPVTRSFIAQPDCLLIEYSCIWAFSPHPPSWPLVFCVSAHRVPVHSFILV